MTALFTVHFTTKKPIRKYDAKGKVVSETVLETPVEIPALTREKAMAYESNPGFRMVPYEGKPLAAKGDGRDQGVGNGVKRTHVAPAGQVIAKPRTVTAKQGISPVSIAVQAAQAGSLGASLNALRRTDMSEVISLDAFRKSKPAPASEPDNKVVPLSVAKAAPVLDRLAPVTAEGGYDYGAIMRRQAVASVRDVLRDLSVNVMPGQGQVALMLELDTNNPGLHLPVYLRRRFPNVMTIILDQWWDDLVVEEDKFSVVLSFFGNAEHIVVPFDALIKFVDLGAQFGLQLKVPAPEPTPPTAA